MIHPSVAIVVDAAAFHFAIGAAAMTDVATVVTTDMMIVVITNMMTAIKIAVTINMMSVVTTVIKIAATINVIVMMIEKTDVMTTGLGDKTEGAAPAAPFLLSYFPI